MSSSKKLTYEIIDGVVYFSDGSVMTEAAYNDMMADPAWDYCPRCKKRGLERDTNFCFYCHEDD